jgi:hypothetical protein
MIQDLLEYQHNTILGGTVKDDQSSTVPFTALLPFGNEV